MLCYSDEAFDPTAADCVISIDYQTALTKLNHWKWMLHKCIAHPSLVAVVSVAFVVAFEMSVVTKSCSF